MNKNSNIKNMLVLQVIFAIIGVLIILLVKFNLFEIFPTCIFRQKYDCICPTCGITRCTINLVNFNFKSAFMYHPTFFILILYGGITDFIYIINTVSKKNFFKFLYPSIPILCIFLCMHVIQYICRMIIIINRNGLVFL